MRTRRLHPARRPSALRGLPAAGALTGLVAAAALGYGGVVPGPTRSLDIVTAGQQVKPRIQTLHVPTTASSAPEQHTGNTSRPQPQPMPQESSRQSSASPNPSPTSSSPAPGSSSAGTLEPPAPSDAPSGSASPSESSAPSGSPSPAPTPTTSPSRSSSSPTPPSPSPTPTPRQAQPQADSGTGAVASLAKTSTDDYSMLGVTWAPGSAPEDLRVQMRSRGEQGWTDWTALEVDPDGPTRTEDSSVRAGTKPAWVGTSNGVQVRALSDHGDAPADLQVDLIDPGQSTSPRLMSSTTALTGIPRIISRRQWGADESLSEGCWNPKYGKTVQGVVVHHTVNSNDYSESESDNLVRGIYAYHTRSRGWCDIGYNFLIDRYGNIFEGRDGGVRKPVRGAHAGISAVNEATAGISLIGRFDTGYPTRAMKNALVHMVAWELESHYRNPHGSTTIGGARYPVVAGHRDIHSTACPGQHVYDWLPRLRNRVANRMGAFHSAIFKKWQRLGGKNGSMGSPFVGERWQAKGRNTTFNRGKIYWSDRTGAHEIHSRLRKRYHAEGGPGGHLGYPTTDVKPTSDQDGYRSRLQHGVIYTAPRVGPHEVHGPIMRRYARMGWTTSRLGLPTSNVDPVDAGKGSRSKFQHGVIYRTRGAGAFEIHGPIKRRYARMGWTTSRLGLPTSNVHPVTGGLRSDFQHGWIRWDRSTGKTTVHRS